jgi:integrase
MRPTHPWYWRAKNAWYVEIAGQRHCLGKHPEDQPKPKKRKRGDPVPKPPNKIKLQFHLLMAQQKGEVPKGAYRAFTICKLFLTAISPYLDEDKVPSERPKAGEPQPELKPNPTHEVRTYWWYKGYLQSFCDKYGHVKVGELIPHHITTWLNDHPGWNGSRRCAVVSVKRAFAWAEGEGLIDESPFRKVKKDAVNRRDRLLTTEEREKIFDAIRDRPFKDFVFAMQETGCRPSEIARLTAADVNLDDGLWVIQLHKSRKKTGKPRVVYLTPAMAELTARLVEAHPSGPLFRGPRGKRGFSRNAIRCRFRNLRRKLPGLRAFISYTYRHTYITDALEQGVPAATVAELVGHNDIKMIEQHYSHLSQKVRHLREAAARARGEATSTAPPPGRPAG